MNKIILAYVFTICSFNHPPIVSSINFLLPERTSG